MRACESEGCANLEEALLLHKADPLVARSSKGDSSGQKPSTLLVPGLAARPWWTVQQLKHGSASLAVSLFDAAPEIRQEFDTLRVAKPVHNSCMWPRWTLMEEGMWIQDHCNHCKLTVSLLKLWSLCDSAFGYVYFSVLPANSQVGRHHGVTNLKLRCHLTLCCPPMYTDCGMRVQDDTRAWKAKELLIFDDSYEHEVWNRSDTERVVLIFDVWHPQLTNKNIECVRTQFAPAAFPETACVNHMLDKHALEAASWNKLVVEPSIYDKMPSHQKNTCMASILHCGGLVRSILLGLPVTHVLQLSCACHSCHSFTMSEVVWGDLLWRDFHVKSSTSYKRYKEIRPPLVRCPPCTDIDVTVKIIMAGDSGVGKTSFLSRLVDQNFCDAYICSVGVDFKLLTVRYKGLVVKLQLWDLAGPERFRTLSSAYFRGGHGVLLMYNQHDRASFDHVLHWHNQIARSSPEDVPVMLCGNKCDLQPEVSEEEGRAVAANLGTDFVLTSAKTGLGVELAVASLLPFSLPVAQRRQQTNLQHQVGLARQEQKHTMCCVQ